MQKRVLTKQLLEAFYENLKQDEKSNNTIEKYKRDTMRFFAFIGDREVTKELVLSYKQNLLCDSKSYADRSINSMLVSVNCLLDFLSWTDCRVKTLKIQQEAFTSEDRELTKEEFDRLVTTAYRTGKEKIALIIQTICGTGIRVSELEFITVEAVHSGEAIVHCKGKIRKVFIVKKLRRLLMSYAKKNMIKSGVIFFGRTGEPIRRTTIWREMKNLCQVAGVKATKVFLHNLRHLFARVYYRLHKDIAKLADILGHSSVNTTRIYIISSGEEHRRDMERMRLII